MNSQSTRSPLKDDYDDQSSCLKWLIEPKKGPRQCSQIRERYQHFIKRLRYNRSFIAFNPSLAVSMVLAISIMLAIIPSIIALSQPEYQSAHIHQQYLGPHQHNQHHIQHARGSGLEPGDYVDEAGELEVMANQQQIPTAQLMAAAGHIVPENFFLSGGSIPAIYSRYQQQHQHHHQQQHQQHQQQQQQQQEPMQQVGSHLQPRHISPGKYVRQADLLAAASAAVDQHENSPLIDFHGYNLVGQTDARDAGTHGNIGSQAPVDLVDFLSPTSQSALYEQHHYAEQQQHYAEQQIAAELAAMAAANHQQQNLDNSAQASENSVIEAEHYAPSSIGPAYQISNHHPQEMVAYGGYDKEQSQKPYGLPTKSSNKEPSGMLKPLGNPKTISSPAIDFVNQLPKTSNFDKLADKLPPVQTPTVFSFSSSKDPMEKVKMVNQKKRTVMRQAEQLARMMIKSVNDKFGTTIGDQTDIPFLLSSLGPLGMAQNLLFDPTLLVTLLNSAEKTYFSDVLPGPAKTAIRPVLNLFRVPNKKRDKANLLNIISFLASGGQTPSGNTPKHRQGTGVEKASKNKNKK